MWTDEQKPHAPADGTASLWLVQEVDPCAHYRESVAIGTHPRACYLVLFKSGNRGTEKMKLYGMMVFMDIPQYNVNMEKIFQGFPHFLTNPFL